MSRCSNRLCHQTSKHSSFMERSHHPSAQMRLNFISRIEWTLVAFNVYKRRANQLSLCLYKNLLHPDIGSVWRWCKADPETFSLVIQAFSKLMPEVFGISPKWHQRTYLGPQRESVRGVLYSRSMRVRLKGATRAAPAIQKLVGEAKQSNNKQPIQIKCQISCYYLFSTLIWSDWCLRRHF